MTLRETLLITGPQNQEVPESNTLVLVDGATTPVRLGAALANSGVNLTGFAYNAGATVGLNLAYASGTVYGPLGSSGSSGGTVAVLDNTQSFVWVDNNASVFNAEFGAPLDGFMLFKVEAQAGVIASVIDLREYPFIQHGTGSGTPTDFANDPNTTTGLDYGFKTGIILRPSGEIIQINAGTVTLPDNDNSTIYVDTDGSNVLSVSDSAFLPPAAIILASVDTAGGSITAIYDQRTFLNPRARYFHSQIADGGFASAVGLDFTVIAASDTSFILFSTGLGNIDTSTVTLTDNATNYVEIGNDNNLAANTVGFTLGKLPIAIVETLAGEVTRIQDRRPFASVPVPGVRTGNGNTAAGDDALPTLGAGDQNNTAYGDHALFANTTGQDNVAIGTQALETNTTGNNNIAIGRGALHEAQAADNNIAIGHFAMNDAIVTGINNIAVGNEALTELTSGENNTVVGGGAATNVTTGSRNTAVGFAALAAITTNDENVAVGALALTNQSTGLRNTAVGFAAGSAITSGSDNTFVGYKTAFDDPVTGSHNVGVGTSALQGLTAGGFNVAVGHVAMVSHQTGDGNVAVGPNASQVGTTQSDTTAVGDGALLNNTADNATAVGSQSLTGNTSGTANTGVGHRSLVSNSTGTDNTAVGDAAGDILTTGNHNTCIGSDADVSGATAVNQTALGAGAKATANNTVQIGNTSVLAFNVGAAIAVGSLPSAATVGAGARAFVTDAITTLALGIGTVVANGGANKVPVYSDGTNWLYG